MILYFLSRIKEDKRLSLKERIIGAAEQVIQMQGLARTTTKEIARAAGCSEGSLYNNFANKEDVFIHVLRKQLSNLMRVLSTLVDRKGTGTVLGNLEVVANTALEDYYDAMPLMTAIFSEHDFLLRHRELIMSVLFRFFVTLIQLRMV
jgi:AcrR family transcriptional regulator